MNYAIRTLLVVLFGVLTLGLAFYEFFVKKDVAGALFLVVIGIGVPYAYFEEV